MKQNRTKKLTRSSLVLLLFVACFTLTVSSALYSFVGIRQTGSVNVTSNTYGKIKVTNTNTSDIDYIGIDATFALTTTEIVAGQTKFVNYRIDNTGTITQYISFDWDDTWFDQTSHQNYGFTYGANNFLYDGVTPWTITNTFGRTATSSDKYAIVAGHYATFRIWYSADEFMIPATPIVDLGITTWTTL